MASGRSKVGAQEDRPPFILGQTEAQRDEKNILQDHPPLSKGMDDRPPPPLFQGLDLPLYSDVKD